MRGWRGSPSQLEAWALKVLDVVPDDQPAAVPQLGSSSAGLVFLATRLDAKRRALDGLREGAGAEVTIAAVVRGEPSSETIAHLRDEEGLTIRVVRSSEGLRLGRLSIVLVTHRRCPMPGQRLVRQLLGSLGHGVIGNSKNCAKPSGIHRTFLAVVKMTMGHLSVEVAVPPSFGKLLDKDAYQLLKQGGGQDCVGRTEHDSGLVAIDGLELTVPVGVFVPRRSAVAIVEAACSLPLPGSPRVLDAGIGSGVLLLALLNRLNNAVGLGIDIDPAAVEAATANASANGLAARSSFRRLAFRDIAELVDEGAAGFDLVVSNPPFFPARFAGHVRLSRDLVTQPSAAFFAGDDGLLAYAELAESLGRPGVLAPKAWLVVSCPAEMAADAVALFREAGHYEFMQESSVSSMEHDHCLVLRKR